MVQLFAKSASAGSEAAQIQILSGRSDTLECRIQRDGSSFLAIIGRYVNGHFICFPQFGLSSDLSRLSDVFWNTEKLEEILSPEDACAVAVALSQITDLTEE